MAGEKLLQGKIMKKCKECGIFAFKAESQSLNGMPDLVLIKDGVVCFVEVKNPNGKGRLSKFQARFINKLDDQGGNTYVISSCEQFDAVLQRHYGGTAEPDQPDI